MINQLVLKALEGIDVPVQFQHYSGTADPYITFFTYLDRPEQSADDAEIITGYYVQVDIWSKRDYTVLAQTVHQKMLSAGFIKKAYYDLYEQDLKIYHKAMRFQLNKEVL